MTDDLAEALIFQGNALEDAGRVQEALARYEKAAELSPGFVRAHLNRGNALLALGETERAVTAYEEALRRDSTYAPAHYNLGNALASLGRIDEAISAYDCALALRADFADAEVARGALLQDAGRIEESVACYRRAVAISPEYAEAHLNLGIVLLQLAQLEDAAASCRTAVQLRSNLVAGWNALGNVEQARKRYEAAAEAYSRVIALQPDFASAHANLGNSLQGLGQTEEAIKSYQRFLALRPGEAKAHYDLGNAFTNLQRLSEAIEAYREAIRLNPQHVDAHTMLANRLADVGRFHDALEICRRALVIAPQDVNAHGALGNTYRQMGRMHDAIAAYDTAIRFDSDDAELHSRRLFLLNAVGEKSPSDLFNEAIRFGALADASARRYTTWSNCPNPLRPLRIGIVSGDLRRHPVGYFIDNVLTALRDVSRAQIELFAYSNHPLEDDVSYRLRACCREWRFVAAVADAELASQIRADQIDILIDLSGHTAHNRLMVFAWKPAPIQVTWLGYFATTGIAQIDYLIADPWTLPESESGNFTEKIWRLPETRLCFTPPSDDVPVSKLPSQTNGTITFGCFNHLAKMTPLVAEVWASILRSIPRSRLLLKCKSVEDPNVRRELLKNFRDHEVAMDRLLFEPVSERNEYLKSYHRVDIALDPFPYPGGTTTVEALWMGVPVLTLAGRSFLSRQGVGLLANAGLHDWIANDEDDYVARVVEHCQNLQRLGALRLGLRKRVLSSPIFDAPRFATHFQEALRAMWVDWCSPNPLA